MPGLGLASLITAQHFRPFQPLPMLFPPVLLFSSYLNLSNYKTDAAGITAAWSGLYALLAIRRSQVSKFSSSFSGFRHEYSAALLVESVLSQCADVFGSH